MNPDDFTQVYNDSFVKQYLTALIKRQWGQNLIKFNNVQLPGGVSLNGRQLFEDAQKEIELSWRRVQPTMNFPNGYDRMKSIYFPQHGGVNTEQNLIQSLVDEQIKLFGSDVYYLPRKMIKDVALNDFVFRV